MNRYLAKAGDFNWSLPTRRSYAWSLELLVRSHPTLPLTEDQVRSWANTRSGNAATGRTHWRNLKAFLRWANRSAGVPLPQLYRTAPRLESKVVVIPDLETVQRAIDLDFRFYHRTLFRTVALTGGRIGGVVSLTQDHVGPNYIITQEKDGEQRHPIPEDLSADLRKLGKPYVFHGVKTPHLTTSGGYQIISEMLRRTGAKLTKYGPHALRATFAVYYYQQTKDIWALKTLLGHSSIAVTEGYLRGLGAAVGSQLPMFDPAKLLREANGGNVTGV